MAKPLEWSAALIVRKAAVPLEFDDRSCPRHPYGQERQCTERGHNLRAFARNGLIWIHFGGKRSGPGEPDVHIPGAGGGGHDARQIIRIGKEKKNPLQRIRHPLLKLEMRHRKIVHRGFTLHSVIPALEKVQRARNLLKSYLPQTRLVAAPSLGKSVYLKLETDLPTGSFKPRGAIFALSENLARGPVREVIASSTGNHGAAVAYAAKLLKVPARIFLPCNPNPVKRKRIADLGAEIVEVGAPDLVGSSAEAMRYATDPAICFLNDATDHDVPCGAGTSGLEILEQLPQVQTIYVPMGDTALIRGIAAAAKHVSPKIRIIGVQAERAPAYYLSWKQGAPVPTDTCDTIADGLATRTPETDNVSAIRELLDDVLLVSEEQMLTAIRHLLFEERVVAEPSGAATTAAWMNSPAEGEAVLLVTGANIAPQILRQAVCGISAG